MKAGISEKISTWTFYALMAISAVVLVLFFFIGFDNVTTISGNTYTDPENLDVLMYWMYTLVAACVIFVAAFVIIQFFATLKSEPKAALKSLLSIVLLAALFGGAYAASDDSTMIINGSAFDDKGKIILTDVCIYVQYVLVLVTVICTIVSLLGLLKFVNKVKA